MVSSRRYYAEQNKSDIDKYLMMSLTYGIYEAQQSEKRCVDAEGKWVVARREVGWGVGEIDKGD